MKKLNNIILGYTPEEEEFFKNLRVGVDRFEFFPEAIELLSRDNRKPPPFNLSKYLVGTLAGRSYNFLDLVSLYTYKNESLWSFINSHYCYKDEINIASFIRYNEDTLYVSGKSIEETAVTLPGHLENTPEVHKTLRIELNTELPVE